LKRWGKPHPFARSNVGQFYFELCTVTSMTLRELGDLKHNEPEQYAFLEEALGERNRRIVESRRKRRR